MSDSEAEEEILVVIEFEDSIPASTEGTRIKMIGLDTDAPTVQYEKQVFRGEWMESIGTKVLFGEKKRLTTLDPVFAPQIPKQYECLYTTTKVLQLKSHVLTPKVADVGESKKSADEEVSDEGSSDGKVDGLPGLMEEAYREELKTKLK